MTLLLRDGSKVADKRCGLIFSGDTPEVPGLFAMAPPDGGIDLSERELISKVRIKTPGQKVFNQGKYGSCVGQGFTAAGEHEDGIQTLGEIWALDFYFAVQKVDSYPGGEYSGAKPRVGGTSIEDALELAYKIGYIEGFCRARTVEEAMIGIGYYSTAIFGMMWTDGMMTPDKQGICRPIGRKAGGHCIAGTIVNLDKEIIGGPNSWGPVWNKTKVGYWFMKVADVDNQLRNCGGECWLIKKSPAWKM